MATSDEANTRISNRVLLAIALLAVLSQLPNLVGGNVATGIGGVIGGFIFLTVVYAVFATVYRRGKAILLAEQPN